MSAQPNAILAINSLDRYINSEIKVFSDFDATWATCVNTIQYEGGTLPSVGSELIATGIPSGTFITAYTPPAFPGASPTTAITISQNTTTTQVAPAYVGQITISSKPSQPISNVLFGAYNDVKPYANDFTIQSPGALIYGYMKKLIVSQIQVQYNVPTINTDLNDTFYIVSSISGTENYYEIGIPYGYYTPEELAAMLQIEIRIKTSTTGGAPIADMEVAFDERFGFEFTSATRQFAFPSPVNLQAILDLPLSLVNNVYKTYKILGMAYNNSTPEASTQKSFDYPNFLYTPYIDIYSDILTNYQTIKDTDTSTSKIKGLISRVYLSGAGSIQNLRLNTALGSSAFVMTADLNTPKVINWTPDVAVPSIDFQVRDCYGDLLPGADRGFSTEFQITLLCVEGRN